MKNSIKTLAAIALFFLTSCSGSIDSDAQKVADLQCDVKKMQQEGASMQDVQALMRKSQSMLQEMQSKYSTTEDKQEFAMALSKATAKCN